MTDVHPDRSPVTPQGVMDDVIAELLTASPGHELLTDDAAEHAAAVTELVEAANRPVFAPDPLADPASVLLHARNADGEEPDDEPDDIDPAESASLAAARAGIVVRPVDTHIDVSAAVSILDVVFAPDGGHHFYPPSLLRNLLAAGAPMLLGWDGETPVGVVLALPGWSADGRPLVQSGPMAVVPEARGRGISIALKLAQRAWALSRSVTEIRWTFDVMANTNAHLNLHRLRAVVEAFLPGYEGIRDADTPAPVPYDRLLVAWHLNRPPSSASAGPRRRGVGVARPWAVADCDGRPVVAPDWTRHQQVLVALPASIGQLRRADPQSASDWQHATGAVLQEALTAGWTVGWDPLGSYLLSAPAQARVAMAGA